jgi:predicted transcriptional regulator of viral defense system
MKLLEAYAKLELLNDAAIQTRDAAVILKVDTNHASKILERLALERLIVPIKKGLWAFPKRMPPLLLPRYCAQPFASYVSLQTALYQHDMIMQVPSVIYAVSLARTKQFVTVLGEVSMHHMDPTFFFGYDVDPKTDIALATPEKALLDFFYLSSAKSHLFGELPEIELPKTFSLKKAREMIKRIPSLQRRTLVEQRFEKLTLH